MKTCANYSIGVFDSGLGGLTVVKALIKLLPHEDIVYFGDTARVPYGTKSPESIIQFSKENTKVLLKHNVKLIVVACNSSSSYALDDLRENFELPVLGVIYPGAGKAVKVTRNKRVGVIATNATCRSKSYEKTIRLLDRSVKVLSRPCPLFVPLVEEGWAEHDIALRTAKEYLVPFKKEDIDTIILGCTHYPLLKNTIQKAVGKNVTLIDSADEVAEDVKTVLEESGWRTISRRKGRLAFLVSDKPQEFDRIAKQFLGQKVKAKKI